MKRLITTLCLLGIAASASAIDKAALGQRIVKLTAKFDEMQSKLDKRVPAENLRKAYGIILMDRTKAGFLFAYQGGSGLAMVKDPLSQRWSAPTFLKANEASLGFLIGGQQSFVVVLLMNTNATHMLTQSSFDFGGEASGTAGNSSGKAEGTVESDSRQLTKAYSDSTGLYGGAAIKGGGLSVDAEANVAYYGQYLTPKEILFDKKLLPSEAATALARRITQASAQGQ